MNVLAIILAIVVGGGVATLLFKPFFGNRTEFFRCVKFWLMPDIVSLFRGEFMEDWWAESKLGFWIGASALSSFLTYAGMLKLLG